MEELRGPKQNVNQSNIQQTEMQQNQTLEAQVRKIDRKLDQLLNIVGGNELDKDDKGILGVKNDHEKRIRRLEKIGNAAIWFLIGLSVPAGWGIIDILRTIVK